MLRPFMTIARFGPPTRVSELAWLERDAPAKSFPPAESALREPDGLLAAGGDLSAERLLYAYQHGIFPWYEAGQPVLWWSPDPRCVLESAALHRSRSLRRTLRRQPWTASANQAFAAVVEGCAEVRDNRRSTWITPAMVAAYCELHDAGYARSVEVWDGERLVGGIYGVCIGRMFFGESMFSRAPDGSKVALLALCREMQRNAMPLLDCQVRSAHLATLGATLITRRDFLSRLSRLCPRIEPSPPFTTDRIDTLKLGE